MKGSLINDVLRRFIFRFFKENRQCLVINLSTLGASSTFSDICRIYYSKFTSKLSTYII